MDGSYLHYGKDHYDNWTNLIYLSCRLSSRIFVSVYCRLFFRILSDSVRPPLWVTFSQHKKATFLPEYLHFNEDPVVNQSKTDQMETIINNSDLKSKLLMISYDWMGVSMFATIMTRGQHRSHSFCWLPVQLVSIIVSRKE